MNWLTLMESLWHNPKMGCTLKIICLVYLCIVIVYILYRYVKCVCSSFPSNFLPSLLILNYILFSYVGVPQLYVDYADSASRSTQNLPSAAWEIYALDDE